MSSNTYTVALDSYYTIHLACYFYHIEIYPYYSLGKEGISNCGRLYNTYSARSAVAVNAMDQTWLRNKLIPTVSGSVKVSIYKVSMLACDAVPL